MVLTKGRDFKWNFQYLDDDDEPVDWPDGDLYFEFPFIKDEDDLPVVWAFTLEGALATLKVESADADAIPARAKWQLVFLPAGEVAGGDALAVGSVRRQG
jgi:hypothetical protein